MTSPGDAAVDTSAETAIVPVSETVETTVSKGACHSKSKPQNAKSKKSPKKAAAKNHKQKKIIGKQTKKQAKTAKTHKPKASELAIVQFDKEDDMLETAVDTYLNQYHDRKAFSIHLRRRPLLA